MNFVCLKRNANYKKWVEWGLRHLVPKAQAQGCPAALARIVDIVGRGRLDLELVGKVGDSKTDAFLTAIHQHYLPRKIISFVDPDDHRLEIEALDHEVEGIGAVARRHRRQRSPLPPLRPRLPLLGAAGGAAVLLRLRLHPDHRIRQHLPRQPDGRFADVVASAVFREAGLPARPAGRPVRSRRPGETRRARR